MKRVKSGLKKLFIPHKGNDYKPHLLRHKTSSIFLIVIVFTEILVFSLTLPFIADRISFLANVLPTVLISETNTERIDQNLDSLVTNPLLEEAAQLKANDMANNGYFSHNSPDGKSPWYWLKEVGYKYQYAGENLAVNFIDSNDVVDAWMNSPTHKANILNGLYTEIGIATSKGEYKGKETIFIVQFFGKPSAPISVLSDNLNNDELVVDSKTENLVVDDVLYENVVTDTENTYIETLGVTDVSIIDEAKASPRIIASIILMMIAVIVTVGIILKIFIARKIQFPKLVMNGMIILAVIASFLVLNLKYFVIDGLI